MSGHLLEAHGLVKRYDVRVGLKKRALLAVDGVSLHMDAGETLGLVGESAAANPRWAARFCALRRPPPARCISTAGA